MNAKGLKKLRSAARTALKSSKLKGSFEREEYMRQAVQLYGGIHKQGRRAVRLAAKKFYQKPPTWAQRLEFKRQRLEEDFEGVKKYIWRSLGLVPVPA